MRRRKDPWVLCTESERSGPECGDPKSVSIVREERAGLISVSELYVIFHPFLRAGLSREFSFQFVTFFFSSVWSRVKRAEILEFRQTSYKLPVTREIIRIYRYILYHGELGTIRVSYMKKTFLWILRSIDIIHAIIHNF